LNYIFFFGFYQVVMVWFGRLYIIMNAERRLENYRYGRYPLRPWLYENHPWGLHKPGIYRVNFREYSLDPDLNPAVHKGIYWTEGLQRYIGDHCPCLEPAELWVNPAVHIDDFDQFKKIGMAKIKATDPAFLKREHGSEKTRKEHERTQEEKRQQWLKETGTLDDDKSELYFRQQYQWHLQRREVHLKRIVSPSEIHRRKGTADLSRV